MLQSEGIYIYGREPLVTVTNVVMSPDMALAKIYVSVYNTENKQAVVLMMDEERQSLRKSLARRIKSHVRIIPHISFFLDDTLDEIFRVESLFQKIRRRRANGKKYDRRMTASNSGSLDAKKRAKKNSNLVKTEFEFFFALRFYFSKKVKPFMTDWIFGAKNLKFTKAT